MPLPLGHAAGGLAIYELYAKNGFKVRPWKALVFIVVLTNLPDIDVLIGLIFHGNGDIFHRGPTHSLLFSLVISAIVSNTWRCWSKVPKVPFLLSLLLLLSHLFFDAIFTSAPVSFWWPLEVHWSGGYSGWSDVIDSVLFGVFRDVGVTDIGIIFAAGIVIVLNRLFKDTATVVNQSRMKREQ
jgi:membrane-bound metal-dependent hydrolase YbcI (DUF457 family)